MNFPAEKTPPTDVENLVWAMLDEQISEQDFRLLDETLRDDEQARQLYLQCVQLHVDLANFYATKEKTPARSTVAPPLSISLPTIDPTFADPAM
jgi:hypothetical protein